MISLSLIYRTQADYFNVGDLDLFLGRAMIAANFWKLELE
jgi:hypothetical protein